MKKSLFLSLFFITIILLSSCNLNQNQNEVQSQNNGDIAQLSANDIAIKMYEAAIEGEVSVFDEQLGETKLLACRFPSNDMRLDESVICGKVVFDLDQDGISEYIIQSRSTLDSIVLHYYNGKVYSYPFEYRFFNNLKKDGSFYWNGPVIKEDESSAVVYDRGARRLSFEGKTIVFEDIYKTVYDENKNAKHFIDDEEVTYDEMMEYLQNCSNDFVEDTPFEASWYKAISEEDAVRIASEYWNVKNGDVSKESGFPLALIPKHSDNSNYRIALSWLVEGSHYSTIEMVEIDAFTGEIVDPKKE